MKYLKTNEQLEEFYVQENNAYIIVSEDEKWVLDSKTDGEASFRFKKEDDTWTRLPNVSSDIYIISPISSIGNWFNEAVHTSKAKADEFLEKVLSKVRMPYGYYIKDIEMSEEQGEKHIISLSKKYPNGIDPIIITNKPDGDSFPSIETQIKVSGGHPVIGMKFKIVEYQMGFQKKSKLNI